MKHAQLRSVVHNVADSLASGVGILIGYYQLDVFGEAARSSGKALVIDFLEGAIIEGEGSQSLMDAVAAYRTALAGLCTKAGGSIDDLREARVRYWSDALDHWFAVTIEDLSGRRSTTDYSGIPGRRPTVLDALGRRRRMKSLLH